jgi:hypothetical protein
VVGRLLDRELAVGVPLEDDDTVDDDAATVLDRRQRLVAPQAVPVSAKSATNSVLAPSLTAAAVVREASSGVVLSDTSVSSSMGSFGLGPGHAGFRWLGPRNQ